MTRIKEIRLAKGILQEALGVMVGMSQAEVSRKENGLSPVTTDQLKLFADALGVKTSELLDETIPKAAGE